MCLYYSVSLCNAFFISPNSKESGNVLMARVITQIHYLISNKYYSTNSKSYTELCDCKSGTRKTVLEQFRIWQPDFFFGFPEIDGAQPVGTTVEGLWSVGSAEEGNTLSVTVASHVTIAAEMMWQFAFVLRNSGAQPLKPRISVADEEGRLVEGDVKLNGTVMSGRDAADFVAVSIREDSDVFSVQSNITLAVNLNCPLLSLDGVGATLTVSGLVGFQTPSGTCRVERILSALQIHVYVV